jgi:hypothetical protein
MIYTYKNELSKMIATSPNNCVRVSLKHLQPKDRKMLVAVATENNYRIVWKKSAVLIFG